MSVEHSDADLWVRRFHPWNSAPARVICLPHAGGAASYFMPVSKALAGKAEVLAIQYPGRQDRHREAGLTSVPALADAVAAALGPWLDRPFVLFGHSMGASVGFEVARRLEAAGSVAVALFPSGRVPPSRARDERVHLQDDDGLIRAVKELSGTDAQVFADEELLRMVLPALRSDYTAAETYRWEPGPPLATPVHAHVGDRDPKVDVDEARDWEKHTTGGFSLTVHSGGHFYLDQHAAKVIQAIVDVLPA